MLELAPLIRRRLQYKLSGHDRRLFDTQDLLSTILRRVDAMIAKGTLRATTDRELISLVLTMLDNTLIDRHRLMQRIKRLEADDRVWASWVRIHERPDDEKIAIDTVTELFDSIESADDRLMLSLRLGGASHSMIAEILEISPAACRQRWVSLKREISAMQPKQMDSGI
ncbi:MAG: sigma-70 family RNA polymerase sigma factor [Phycisphaera sp.]|nr:MAG: sigma-70 family RNA polymerase sigma factor [Phycisphaera sp.]